MAILNNIDENAIKDQLLKWQVPYLEQDLITANAVKQITIKNDCVELRIKLGFPLHSIQSKIIEGIQTALQSLPGIKKIDVTLSWAVKSHAVQTTQKAIPHIKNIIAIASGKGGVGKSTTAVNLALALAKEGARVGILDADIYGPNQPHMLGSQRKPEGQPNKKFKPVICHGLQTMSIGYLVDTTTPMVWRGPMVSRALQQLLTDTTWDDLDYLFVDLPPGTGDIQLTLAQKVPVSGAVIVTTPQDIALLDARKGLEMFRKVNVSVLGIVENMSTYRCTHCGHEEAIFGAEGARRMAEQCDVPLLGQLPLAMEIRQAVDQGCPTVVAQPRGAIAMEYRDIALKLAAQLSLQSINYASRFPEVVVE